MDWGRVHRLCAASLVPLSLALVVARCAASPEVPFVARSSHAPWIMAPMPVTAGLQQWGRDDPPVVSFTRWVEGPREASAPLSLRALRRFSLYANGERVALPSGDGDWRRIARVDLAPWLRAGANEIRVDVENPRGPALLSLRLEGGREPIRSDESWSVAVDRQPLGPAVRADDTRRNPAGLAVETPWRALVRERDTLALLFALGGLAFVAARRFLRPRMGGPALPRLALAAAVGVWALFLVNFLRIPPDVGFDARHHRAYVEQLAREGALPLATDGWSTFHPPLFYAAALLAAGPARLARGGEPPLWALRLIPFLAGLGSVFVAFALARRLYPERPGVGALAVLFAAVLPMNAYASAYFSNESLHAFLGGLALYAVVDALLAPRVRPGRAALLAALLGLAALTKFTTLALVPIALVFVACKQVAIERAPRRRIAATAGIGVATFGAVAGWYYARNWLLLGDPVPTSWNLGGPGRVWWQQPGFRTLAYYTGFGEALVRPFLSGFASLWDALYSTVWGDGFVAGRVYPADRHPHWNYAFMSMGYWAALPATALLGVGAVRALSCALRDPDPRRRAALSFLLTVVWAVALGFLYLSLRVPFYSQAKGPYGLVLAAPAALLFALGASRCDAALGRLGGPAARALGFGWLASFAGLAVLTYAGVGV